jgi:hypothetical protein
VYVDPLADDPTNVVSTVDTPAIFLWAHNRKITYEYTGDQLDTLPYCDINQAASLLIHGANSSQPLRSKLSTTVTPEFIKYHIPAFWDDEFKRLDYVNEPFNDPVSLNLWTSQGYANQFTGDMCDMRSPQPSWNQTFIDIYT